MMALGSRCVSWCCDALQSCERRLARELCPRGIWRCERRLARELCPRGIWRCERRQGHLAQGQGHLAQGQGHLMRGQGRLPLATQGVRRVRRVRCGAARGGAARDGCGGRVERGCWVGCRIPGRSNGRWMG